MRERFYRLLNWSRQSGKTTWGAWAIFISAFAYASFLPLPVIMIFIALTLLNITQAFRYALFGTLGTFIGAIAGYSVGHFAWLNTDGNFTQLAHFIFNNLPGFSEDIYYKIHILYSKWDFWILSVASFMPIPYKIFSITSGVFDINVFKFLIVTLICQGTKYYLLALLSIKFGPRVRKLFEFKSKLTAIIIISCILLTIVIINVF